MAYHYTRVDINKLSIGDIILVDAEFNNSLGLKNTFLLAKVLDKKILTSLVEVVFIGSGDSACLWFPIKSCYYASNEQ